MGPRGSYRCALIDCERRLSGAVSWLCQWDATSSATSAARADHVDEIPTGCMATPDAVASNQNMLTCGFSTQACPAERILSGVVEKPPATRTLSPQVAATTIHLPRSPDIQIDGLKRRTRGRGRDPHMDPDRAARLQAHHSPERTASHWHHSRERTPTLGVLPPSTDATTERSRPLRQA